MALNSALKLAIFTSKKTQRAIAGRIGMREDRLSLIVRGHERATDTERKALAKALKRPVHELFPEEVAS